MSLGETIGLGALAGFTIYLGLPFGRLHLLSDRARVGLAMFSVGVLAFLFVDVLSHAFEIVEDAVAQLKDDKTSFGHTAALALLLGGGFALGSAGLAMVQKRMRPRSAPPPVAGGSVDTLPVSEADRLAHEADTARARALRTGMTIAGAIGLHNFAEGLAIGVAASTGEISLATVLIVGFALHNATEGFGIVAPLAAEPTRPSWGFLLLLGLIGGGPTFIGTAVGWAYSSAPLSVLFLSLAAGSILYVVIQLLGVTARERRNDLVAYGVLAGLLAGFATDAVVTLGGV
jgi:zinc transporter, ZIP family